jgi:hypothetical protein
LNHFFALLLLLHRLLLLSQPPYTLMSLAVFRCMQGVFIQTPLAGPALIMQVGVALHSNIAYSTAYMMQCSHQAVLDSGDLTMMADKVKYG